MIAEQEITVHRRYSDFDVVATQVAESGTLLQGELVKEDRQLLRDLGIRLAIKCAEGENEILGAEFDEN